MRTFPEYAILFRDRLRQIRNGTTQSVGAATFAFAMTVSSLSASAEPMRVSQHSGSEQTCPQPPGSSSGVSSPMTVGTSSSDLTVGSSVPAAPVVSGADQDVGRRSGGSGTDLPEQQSDQGSAVKHPKLDSHLAAVADLTQTAGAETALVSARASGLYVIDDKVRVVIEAVDGDAAQIGPLIGSVGGTVESSYETLTQALLPVTALQTVAASSAVQLMRAPITAFTTTAGGDPAACSP